MCQVVEGGHGGFAAVFADADLGAYAVSSRRRRGVIEEGGMLVVVLCYGLKIG